LRAADFRLVYDKGFRVSSPLFAAFCLERDDRGPGDRPTSSAQNAMACPTPTGPRLGLTVPRAVSGAVGRNRIKRRLREAFRLHGRDLEPKWDIVLNPRRASLTAEFNEIERALRKVIDKCESR
jgi:ribonuclease P protein component